MSMFGARKPRSPKGTVRVLAYLVDVQRLGAPLKIEDGRGREVPATLDLISEQRVTLTLFESFDQCQGAETHLVFILDGLRFKAPTRVLEIGSGCATVELPLIVELAERRKASRTTMSAREGAAAMAMAGLFNPLAAGSMASLGPSHALVDDIGTPAAMGETEGSNPLPGPGMAEILTSAPIQAFRAGMPWTSKDVASDATFWTTYALDWLKMRNLTFSGRANALGVEQTARTASGASLVYANHEALLCFTTRNPFLGQSPAVKKMSGSALSHGITYTFMTRALPERWRQSVMMNSVRLEAFCAGNNIRLGLRIK